MRKILLSVAAATIFFAADAQNVGIGTTNPVIKLDVHSPTSFTARFNSSNNQMRVLFSENENIRGYVGSYAGSTEDLDIGTMESNATGKLHLTTQAVPRMSIDITGNVGIGTSTPGYKLDVAGRMRLQHTGSGTAGIWLDGPVSATRAFIGMVNDDHVGFYGSGGASWGVAMNVETGNTGIGTSTPTAKLDVNGDIRIRGSVPKVGSVLSSIDADGNARWADPVAFRAGGSINNTPFSINNETWTKILFNQTANHNLGLSYQPLLSQFLVPERGIYHFNAQLHFEEWMYESGVRVVVSRGGNTFVAAENFQHYTRTIDPGAYTNYRHPAAITIDVNLLAGDLVWIEGYADIHPDYGTTTTIAGNSVVTWFSGHIVARY